METNQYTIYGVNGPVITVRGGRGLPMMSMVYVGEDRIPGEVVSARGDTTVVQVYESSEGLKLGQPIFPTGKPMSVLLGPGMLSNIYDGIARPLKTIADRVGSFIARGITLPALDLEKRWEMKLTVREGEKALPGMVFATTQETEATEHRCLVPPHVRGTFAEVRPDGDYRVTEVLAVVVDEKGQTNEHDVRVKLTRADGSVFDRSYPVMPAIVQGSRFAVLGGGRRSTSRPIWSTGG